MAKSQFTAEELVGTPATRSALAALAALRAMSLQAIAEAVESEADEQCRRISTDELVVGMQTMVKTNGGKWQVDCRLKELIPHRGCRGLHFVTTERRNVCYLPGGYAYIAR